MSNLLFTVVFVIAAVVYLAFAVTCYRRGDRLMWPRLATGLGFVLMAVGFLLPSDPSHALTFIGAIVVFVSALVTVFITTRRARRMR